MHYDVKFNSAVSKCIVGVQTIICLLWMCFWIGQYFSIIQTPTIVFLLLTLLNSLVRGFSLTSYRHERKPGVLYQCAQSTPLWWRCHHLPLMPISVFYRRNFQWVAMFPKTQSTTQYIPIPKTGILILGGLYKKIVFLHGEEIGMFMYARQNKCPK